MNGRVNSFRILHILMLALLSGTTLNYVSVLGQVEDEIPDFEGINPGFTPPPESQRTPPPPPPDALTVSELPPPSLARENETDVDPLSVTNRTEILEILPLNSSNIVKFVDEELKNNTGVGLAPGSILENITLEQENQPGGNLSNATILDMLGPQEKEEVANMTPIIREGGEIVDLEEADIASANETEDEVEEAVSPPPTTNETSADNATNVASRETEDEGEEAVSPPPTTTTNETSADNATNVASRETEDEGEEAVSPPPTINETSADNATNVASRETEDEEDQVSDEEDEGPSLTAVPSTGPEVSGLGNETTDLNQTGGTLRDNITNMNNTSLLPTTEDNSDESEEDNSDESEEDNSDEDNESNN
jgi:hypothetical protein